MNREFIEDLSGNVSCIVKHDNRWQESLRRRIVHYPIKRTVHQPYYWCGFCQTAFDLDYPSIRVHDNDQRPHCPNDNHRLELMSADIEVG